MGVRIRTQYAKPTQEKELVKEETSPIKSNNEAKKRSEKHSVSESCG